MKLRRSSVSWCAKPVERRMLIGAGLFGALIAVSSFGTASACGPFSKLAIFSHELHPDFPLQRYAGGELGIVRQNYARSYMAVAYRYFSGLKTTPEQQKAIDALWQARLAPADSEHQTATTDWLTERKKVSSTPLKKDVDVYSFSNYSFGYINYPPYAFINATEQLKKKIARFGVADRRVVDWVVAQDKVFGVGADSNPIEPLPETADPEDRADRNYQIACKSFYDGDYNSAVERFEKIAQDKSSQWQKWGSYLAARALCRKGTTGEKLLIDDLQQAKSLVDKILQSEDLKAMHKEANRLATFIQCKLDPQKRAQEVVAVLSDSKGNQDLATALGDYTVLLDRVAAAEQEKESPSTGLSNSENTISDNAAESGNPLNSLPGLPNDWAAQCALTATSGFFLTRLLKSRKAIDRSQVFRSPVILIACLSTAALVAASCSQSAHSVPDKSTNTEAPATTTGGTDTAPPPLVLEDDMTKWIFNMEDDSPDAAKEAYETWKKTASLPWLIATLNATKASNPHKDEVLDAALKVGTDSPAYLTATYHRIRLLKESGKSEDAIKLCQSILNMPADKLPPSSRNLIIQQYTPLVATLADFAKIAAPSPAAIVWDYDIAEVPEDVNLTKPSPSYAIQQGRLTPEAALILNELAPVSTVTKLATDQGLPAKVRLNLAQAAWVRSILLKDEKAAMTLSPVLRQLLPQLGEGLLAYERAKSPADKEIAAYAVILHNPAMRPYVTSGLDRETAFNKIDSYRDNWWCEKAPAAPVSSYSPMAEEEEKKEPKPVAAFLSKEEQQQGTRQYAGLKTLGTAPNYLAQKMLTLAKGTPNDPRMPELLHIVVSATRYGCTDDTTTGFSKQAFQMLHSKYPGNPWTKKTKYWF